MLPEVLSVLILSAIFVSFMQEWRSIYSKILSIPILRLGLPLIVGSILAVNGESFIVQIIDYMRDKVQWILHDAIVLRVMILSCVAVSPIVFLQWRIQKRKILFLAWPVIYKISVLSWIVGVFLLI